MFHFSDTNPQRTATGSIGFLGRPQTRVTWAIRPCGAGAGYKPALPVFSLSQNDMSQRTRMMEARKCTKVHKSA